MVFRVHHDDPSYSASYSRRQPMSTLSLQQTPLRPFVEGLDALLASGAN
ncbi:cysteine dioxygenase, partial [Burkholderia cenocepacia]|nr:cysteine dioxygenase [Burkholderia cenocepacia]